MKIKPVTIAGLFLAVFGILIVLAIQNISPWSNKSSEENLIIFGLISTWLLGIILLLIVKWGEKQPFASIGFKAITGKEIVFVASKNDIIGPATAQNNPATRNKTHMFSFIALPPCCSKNHP